MSDSIGVSIVIPAYNDLNKLQRALGSIEVLDFPTEKYEVVVIDDGSTDGTGAYVRELMKRTEINLRYDYQENKGPAAARNTGIRLARGEYVLIIDADCCVDRNILTSYLKHFPDSTLGGVGGNVVPDTHNLISEYLDYVSVWRPGVEGGEISYLVTANAFFRTQAIIDAGCFDEDFRYPGGEEPELCYRMKNVGYRFMYDHAAVVQHSHRTTIKSMWRMFYNHGRGNCMYSSKWPELPRWKPSLAVIFSGVNSLHRFATDYVRSVSLVKAIVFALLDYLHNFAFYCGYRSVANNKR